MTVASAGSIRTRITAEVGGKGAPKLSRNFHQRISRNSTMAARKQQEFQPESRAERSDVTLLTVTASTMSTNDEVGDIKPDMLVVIDAESSPPASTTVSSFNPTDEFTTDVALPMWDSIKIETPKTTTKDESAYYDEDESAQPMKSEPELIPSLLVDRKKEAERLRKVISAFHLNRVLGTTAPSDPVVFRGFPSITPAPSTRQRALGFPLLITNTLDNFHHQLDWSRFGSFSAELE